MERSQRGRERQAPKARLRIDVLVGGDEGSTLAADVRAGLLHPPRRIPPKHFYDEVGSKLFDRICDTEEYYQTRTEQALLEGIAGPLLARLRPTELVELGSGAARKIRPLLQAAQDQNLAVRYVPFDVSEEMLRRSAAQLLVTWPALEIHGVVGDYDRHLGFLPPGHRRLLLFLGGTIGNFDEAQSTVFLTRLAQGMGPDDRLLLGVDLIKDRARLHAAYNDRAGLTAAFNRNVLHVINRALGADFVPERFEHLAFFSEEKKQIEMHLRASQQMRVRIADLAAELDFERGETIHTEISRKFDRVSAEAMLDGAGLALEDFFVPEEPLFALCLARRSR